MSKTVSKTSYIDEQVADLIPEFDPSKNVLKTMVIWLNKIDEYAEVREWNEKVTIRNPLTKLRRNAKPSYDSMAAMQRSSVEWKNLLRDAFPSTMGIQRAFQDMVGRKKRPRETMEEYFYNAL